MTKHTFESLKEIMTKKGSTVYDLSNEGYFKNNAPYPDRKEIKDIVKKCECCGAEKIITPAENIRKEMLLEYHREEGRLMKVFKDLLFYEFNVSGKKADKAFDLAWSDGHAYGYAEVASHFEKFVELIKD